jgi:peptidoglycan/LPS O-acetylase OafA/YrhL
MEKQLKSSASFADSKPHYHLLDGLRGVAALLVLWYHIHEGFAFASGVPAIEGISHGYLAVDFFFMLSGFVIAYAYDDRLGKSMSLCGFFKRRLIRLHPMVVMGAIVGMVSFLMVGCQKWDGSHAPISSVMIALLCAMLFIPTVPGGVAEVRGNGEAFPLNGPAWSLFFEYIGNIIYAFVLRRLSNRWLTVLVVALGIGLGAFACLDVSGYGNIGVGWTMADGGFWYGLLRMSFPFTMGMWLLRNVKLVRIKGAFWICAAALVVFLYVPNITGDGTLCLNGIYETVCLVLLFPVVVWIGAGGDTNGLSAKVCKFFGDISFPLYIIHYPVMYYFYAWMIDNKKYTLEETWLESTAVCLLCVLMAYAFLKLYDEPIRKWLAKKFVK